MGARGSAGGAGGAVRGGCWVVAAWPRDAAINSMWPNKRKQSAPPLQSCTSQPGGGESPTLAETHVHTRWQRLWRNRFCTSRSVRRRCSSRRSETPTASTHFPPAGETFQSKRPRLLPLWQQWPDAHFYRRFVNIQLGSVAIYRRPLIRSYVRAADLFAWWNTTVHLLLVGRCQVINRFLSFSPRGYQEIEQEPWLTVWSTGAASPLIALIKNTFAASGRDNSSRTSRAHSCQVTYAVNVTNGH